MHSLFKTSKLAGALFALLLLFLWYGSFAQDFRMYAGTYKGKIDFSGDYPVTSKVNELIFIISDKGDITITYRYDNIYHSSVIKGFEDMTETGNGTATGKLNAGLSFEIIGTGTVSMQGEASRSITPTLFGKIINNTITGQIGKFGQAKFKVEMSADSEPEEAAAGEDCDCSITIPSGLKPGGSLFVITKNTGCVKSEVVYYNGKDSQISNWDGNAVKVEVQIACCNNRAFTKSLTIPAYESDEKIEIVTTEISKGSSLPAPPANQVVVGTSVALAITTLLQALLAGGGTGSIPIPPVTPPKTPPVKPRVRRDEKPVTNIPDNTPSETPEERAKSYAKFIKEQEEQYRKGEVTKNDLTQKTTVPSETPADNKPKEQVLKEYKKFINRRWATEKLTPEQAAKWDASNKKIAQENLKWYEENAEKEKGYTGYNPLYIGRQMVQTVTASYNEVNDLAYRTFEKGFEVEQKLENFKTELDNDPEEAKRLLINTGIALENMKEAATEYVTDGRLKNDLYNAAKNIRNTNNEFCEKLYNNPVETVKTYVKTAVGAENWEHSWDMNSSLEERLLNAGIGIAKTCSTISTMGMGSALLQGASVSVLGVTIPKGLATAWVGLMHQKNLYMPKVLEALPDLIYDAKKNYILNKIAVTVDHYNNEHRVTNAPAVENVNDWLEQLNSNYTDNKKADG